MKKFYRMITAALALTLLLSLSGCGAGDGKTHLVFQIWDVYQRPGMEANCAAYTAQHPDVEIEVQVTSWGEYWTKLEAAAESNTMPDIFWMHTSQLLYYADFGMLADVTDLYDDVDPNYYKNHFSEISCSNASGSDGRLYGVPKDKDNGMLVYNKEMFDAAGVAYPTDDWTWEDMTEASQKIYDATGKYGFMAYNDMRGKWDIAKLPKCTDPIEDGESLDKEGRATMSNGLCYATGAHGKKLEAALDVIKYFGTEETWRSAFSSYEEQLNLDVCFDQFDYAIQAVYNSASPKWKSQVQDELNKAYNGDQDLTTSLENMQSIVNTETAKKLAKMQREGT